MGIVEAIYVEIKQRKLKKELYKKEQEIGDWVAAIPSTV